MYVNFGELAFHSLLAVARGGGPFAPQFDAVGERDRPECGAGSNSKQGLRPEPPRAQEAGAYQAMPRTSAAYLFSRSQCTPSLLATPRS